MRPNTGSSRGISRSEPAKHPVTTGHCQHRPSRPCLTLSHVGRPQLVAQHRATPFHAREQHPGTPLPFGVPPGTYRRYIGIAEFNAAPWLPCSRRRTRPHVHPCAESRSCGGRRPSGRVLRLRNVRGLAVSRSAGLTARRAVSVTPAAPGVGPAKTSNVVMARVADCPRFRTRRHDRVVLALVKVAPSGLPSAGLTALP